jgi:hypothetical protein
MLLLNIFEIPIDYFVNGRNPSFFLCLSRIPGRLGQVRAVGSAWKV